jgi:hypothetical protein
MSEENTNFQIESDEEQLIHRSITNTKRIYWNLIKYDLIMTFCLACVSIVGYFFIMIITP